MKAMRILILILCLLFLCGALFSCRANKLTYTKPTLSSYNNKFNYNNLSAGTNNIFIDDEGVYYNDKELFQRYYRVFSITEDGVTPLFFEKGYLQSVPQKKGDKLYVLIHRYNDSHNTYLMEYDYSTKSQKTVATIPDYWIDKFYVVDNVAYYTTTSENKLCIVNLGTSEILTIKDKINTCGIVDNHLRYVICENSYCSIYEYNVDSQVSVLIGEFDYTQYDFLSRCSRANFTKDAIIFMSNNLEIGPLFYWLDRNEIEQYNPASGILTEAIAYEEYLFFVIDENDLRDDRDYTTHTVYRLCIDTIEVEAIAQFYGAVYIYVMSDVDVFVHHDFAKQITHYNITDGTSEKILVDSSSYV